jgi:hypothetical protein
MSSIVHRNGPLPFEPATARIQFQTECLLINGLQKTRSQRPMYFDSSTDYVAGDGFGFGRYGVKHVLSSSVGVVPLDADGLLGRPQVRGASSETNDLNHRINVVRSAACVPDPPLRGAASSVSNIDCPALVLAQWEITPLCALRSLWPRTSSCLVATRIIRASGTAAPHRRAPR